MTELEDFSETFQRIVRESDSVDEVQQRFRRPLSMGQARVLADYYSERAKQEPRPITFVDKRGRVHTRDSRTGRFIKKLKRLFA